MTSYDVAKTVRQSLTRGGLSVAADAPHELGRHQRGDGGVYCAAAAVAGPAQCEQTMIESVRIMVRRVSRERQTRHRV